MGFKSVFVGTVCIVLCPHKDFLYRSNLINN